MHSDSFFFTVVLPPAIYLFFYFLEDSELSGYVKVEMAVLGSPSLTVRMASADVKQH